MKDLQRNKSKKRGFTAKTWYNFVSFDTGLSQFAFPWSVRGEPGRIDYTRLSIEDSATYTVLNVAAVSLHP